MTATNLKHDFLSALQRQSTEKRPIWMMRQAGRYLPEYRALRQQVPDFMTFCKTPELACKATLQPLERFDLDAAIIFSDILTVPQAMGMNLSFVKNEGPMFADPIRDEKDLARLKIPDVQQQLGYVADAIKLTVKELDDRVPLIGFAGSPWTLATYMIEGSGSKTFLKPRAMLYKRPDLLQQLLDKLIDITVEYLLMQVNAGAQTLMLFDSWGGLLTEKTYAQFSLQPMKTIIQKIKKITRVPIILFSKGGGQWLELMADSGANALGIDWSTDISGAKRRVGDRVALQGNLDPAVLLSSPQAVQQATTELLQAYGDKTGHIFNLGHGIDKDTPIENVAAMIEAVRQFDNTERG
ncbi:MAG: uroporphyrinogen decarboxylase [Gammaproteobacteria bacterium]|nr:uroporphyrinogen decarboxylase [Gammaproteobacteria bacterium]